MIQPEVQEIINRLAKKYNKPVQVIEEIFLSQWRFVKEKISKEDDKMSTYKTIKLPKWGKYYLSVLKLNWIRKHLPEKKKKIYIDGREVKDKVHTGDTSRDRQDQD